MRMPFNIYFSLRLQGLGEGELRVRYGTLGLKLYRCTPACT